MMKSLMTSFAILTLVLFCTLPAAYADTITVGPTGQYPSPCAAFGHLQDGDTVLVDANNGTPYYESDCEVDASNVTISGINGRPILDPGTRNTYEGIWQVKGHDVVIDNFEFRNTKKVGGEASSAGIRVHSGLVTAPDGGNLTVEQCYIYNNRMGLLSDNVGFGGYTKYAWYSQNPYITLQYDEFAFDGADTGQTHNIYISAGGNMTLNLKYSFTHDSDLGHEVKSRAEHNNIYYNFIGDIQGISDYVLDFPLGGDTYVVGNVIYKASVADCSDCNSSLIIYRQYTDTKDSGAYPAPHDDMHFVNNTVVDAPDNYFSGLNVFVGMACYGKGLATDDCPLPSGGGGPLTTPGVFENNIFVGPASFHITNQTEAVLKGNIVLENNSTNLADLFVDPEHLDFHLASGSPAIGAGIYPPTDNTGAADPLVLATEEYVHPMSGTARPTPSGSAMDAGAYSYPRAGQAPTLQLSYNNTVTAPSSSTITVSGMPAPPSGQFNYVELVSGNKSVIPYIETAETSTGSATVTFDTNPVAASVTVPIDIYAAGVHATATVTVNPGPPVLYSVTAAGSKYLAPDTVNLEGPAPAGGLVVNLTSSDPTVLYAPATVVIPEGQISASAGTLAATFLNPSPQTETLTATAGGVTKTLTRAVYTPRLANFGCNDCTVVGGTPARIGAVISYGPAPENGADVTVTSSNTDVIPNQTALQVSPGEENFPGSGFDVTTNAVTQDTQVTITANWGPYSKGTATITVTPPTSGPPAAIAAESGSGQSAAVGSNFTNPLVALVTDKDGKPVPNATVTFAGIGVAFPNGSTATTNSNGQASVVAQPTQTGPLTITASVTGVTAPATFSESATPEVILTSLTVDGSGPGTTVHISTPATVPVVIQLSSSDPGVLYAPATITIPVGADSAETGSMLGGVWTPPSAKTATLTATYKDVTKTAAVTLTSPSIHFFKCSPDSCKDVVGGNPYLFMLKVDGGAPHGGGVVKITSDDPAAFPDQTIPIPQGQTIPPPFKLSLNTNRVTKTAIVHVTATYGSVVTAGPISVTPPGAPASIAAVSGSGQTEAVNTGAFANPLVVLVEDAGGNPVDAGVTVTFSGTGVSFPNGATAVTDGTGHAQVVAEPTATGALTVTASVAGVKTSASFSETGAPPPASIAEVSGSGQTAAAGTNFAAPLVVLVKDANGAPVLNAPVTFAGNEATFPNGATARTNASGEAQVLAQPGQHSVGPFTITATVPGVSVAANFSETGTAGPPASVAAVSGSGQTSTAGTAFPNPLVVSVKDQYGNSISGATVTFAGSNVSFPSGATATTGSNGEAQATAESTKAGMIAIAASVAGVSAPAAFSETVTAGAATSIGAASGSGQTTEAGKTFPNPLVAIVQDQYGNPVSGVTVTFSGAGISFPNGATAVTATNGEAQVTAQSSGAGSFTVTASAAGLTTPATFSLAGVAVASITATSSTARYVKVNLTGPAPAGGAVVTLSSSDLSVVYVPATVTVPAGETSAYAGALIGSLWGQSPAFKDATLTASYGGATQTVTRSFHTVQIHGVFGGGSITGGDISNVTLQSAYGAPAYGSNPVIMTSDNTAVIPNQTFYLTSATGHFQLQTNPVTTTTTVHVTVDYNGDKVVKTYTVNP